MRRFLGGLAALLALTIAQPVLPLHASGNATIMVKTVHGDTGVPATGVQIFVATSVGVAQYQSTAWGGRAVIQLTDDVTDAYVIGIAPNEGPACYGYNYTPITPGATIYLTVPIACYPVR